jgi:hypothetical protein
MDESEKQIYDEAKKLLAEGLRLKKKHLLVLKEEDVTGTTHHNIWKSYQNPNTGNSEAVSAGVQKKLKERRAQSLILDAIRNELINEKSKGQKSPKVIQFVKNVVDEGIKDPNSRSGAMLAEAVGFKDDLIEKLDEEIDKQMMKDQDFLKYRIQKLYFDKQRDVLFDDTVQRKCIICSRRSGKTELAAALIVQTSVIPNSPCLYINLNFSNALRQLWDLVIRLSERTGMVISTSSKIDGTIQWSNGSSLKLSGNSTSAEADKHRGNKYKLVIVDEAGHQRWMKYLIEEVIEPLLLDYGKEAQLVLQGTPPRVPKTFFEKCWNSKEYKNYHWTIVDNPYIPNAEEEVENIAEKKGIRPDSPFIQREYYGMVGVYDTEAMVFKDRKTYEGEYKPTWIPTHVILGMDLGYQAYNAIIGLAYNSTLKIGYIFTEYRFNKSNVTEIVNKLKEALERAKKLALTHDIDPGNIYVYCDSNEPTVSYEFSQTYHLPVINAFKYNRDLAIAQLADNLRLGNLIVPKDGELDQEMEQVIYKRDPDTDAVLPELDEEIGIHPDAVMALLYAFRQMAFDCGYDDRILDAETRPDPNKLPGMQA